MRREDRREGEKKVIELNGLVFAICCRERKGLDVVMRENSFQIRIREDAVTQRGKTRRESEGMNGWMDGWMDVGRVQPQTMLNRGE